MKGQSSEAHVSAGAGTGRSAPLDGERKLWSIAVEQLRYRTPERARFRCEQTFEGVTLSGRDVLEIGAGAGLHSAFAAVRGARRVVALEPEANGSTAGSRSTILDVQRALGLGNLEVSPSTLQTFDPGGRRFDVVLLYNSVNHLDEAACTMLHRSEDACARYRALFRTIGAMMTAGGVLIVADCSRANLWPMIGLRNPFAPSIEWHKHQTPQVWDALLTAERFVPVTFDWYRYHPLRWLGRIGASGLSNFLLGSYFRLVRRYAPQSGSRATA
jgi:hypothetical protein